MLFNLEQSAGEPAELAVFPQHGKALRVIKAESAAAGKVKLSWDGLDSQGNSLAAGSYFLRLSSSKAETVRPITLP
jgi:flagellar hook assembly protein FlgD